MRSSWIVAGSQRAAITVGPTRSRRRVMRQQVRCHSAEECRRPRRQPPFEPHALAHATHHAREPALSRASSPCRSPRRASRRRPSACRRRSAWPSSRCGPSDARRHAAVDAGEHSREWRLLLRTCSSRSQCSACPATNRALPSRSRFSASAGVFACCMSGVKATHLSFADTAVATRPVAAAARPRNVWRRFSMSCGPPVRAGVHSTRVDMPCSTSFSRKAPVCRRFWRAPTRNGAPRGAVDALQRRVSACGGVPGSPRPPSQPSASRRCRVPAPARASGRRPSAR